MEILKKSLEKFLRILFNNVRASWRKPRNVQDVSRLSKARQKKANEISIESK